MRLPVRDWTVPGESVHPVVRVRHYVYGVAAPVERGTGCFVGGWRKACLTAAHVLHTSQHVESSRVEVDIYSSDRSRRYRVFAIAYALPARLARERDQAVLLLGRAVRRVSPRLSPYAPPDEQFDAQVLGFGAGGRFRRMPVQVEPRPPWLRYRSGTSSGGMSGGPLVVGNRVHGTHYGVLRQGATSTDAALASRLELIRECLAAARAAAGE